MISNLTTRDCDVVKNNYLNSKDTRISSKLYN